MRKAFKYRLSPTKKQEQVLFWTLARCRELYNAALAERKEAYRMAGKSISYYDQKRDLVEIKANLHDLMNFLANGSAGIFVGSGTRRSSS